VDGTRKRYFAGSDAENNYSLFIGQENEWYAISGSKITYFGVSAPLTGTPPAIVFENSANGEYDNKTLNKLTVGIDRGTFTTFANEWVGDTTNPEYIKFTGSGNATTAKYTVNTANNGANVTTVQGKVYSRDADTGNGSSSNELFILGSGNLLTLVGTFDDSSSAGEVASITGSSALTEVRPLDTTLEHGNGVSDDIHLGTGGYIYIDNMGTAGTTDDMLRYGAYGVEDAGSGKTLNKYFYNGTPAATPGANGTYPSYYIDGDIATSIGDLIIGSNALQTAFTYTGFAPIVTLPNDIVGDWSTTAGNRLKITEGPTQSPDTITIGKETTAYPVYVTGTGAYKLYYREGKVIKYAGDVTYDDGIGSSVSASLQFANGTLPAIGSTGKVWKLEDGAGTYGANLVGSWLLDGATDILKDGIIIAGSSPVTEGNVNVLANNLRFGSNDGAGGTFAHGAGGAYGQWWSIKTADGIGGADTYYVFFLKHGVFTALPEIAYTDGMPDDITFTVGGPIINSNVKFEQQ
jgi:hypothetical protein